VLFFAFHDGTTALWRSDGTPQGTARVSPLDLVGSVSPPELRPLAGGALLVGVPPSEIWYSDGTAAGTRRLAQPQGRSTSEHAEVDGVAYFTASRSGSGGDLWRSDGTVAGTYRVLAAAEAGWLAGPSELLAFDGLLVFTAEDVELGSELWLSDGTPGGTRPLVDLHPGPGGSRPSQLTAVGDRLFFSADDAIHGRELWVTDGTVGGSRRAGDVAAGPASSRPEELTAAGGLLYFRATDGVHGVEPWALPLAVDVGPCVAGESTLCLGADSRFGVAVEWHDQHNGGSGVGRAVPVAGSEKTGAFWFFGPDNLELLVKVLDGAGINGYHWVFWGGLSDVEYTLVVTDHETGLVRRYRNPPGRICGGADTTAFAAAGGTGAAAVTGAASRAAAPAAGEPLLLAGERFRVEVDWRNQRTGVIGTGLARPVTDNTGFFSFFDSANVELVVKVLDGRPVNGRFWVFYGALTDVEYTILVTDTASGGEVSYHNPPGEICGEADTAAF
jgi:ELWxxDGT repeat protein